MNLENKLVTVVGLGMRTGIEVVKFLAQKNAKIIITDAKEENELTEELDALEEYEFQLDVGGHSLELILESDLIVVSPGVPADIPLLQQAEEKEIEIIGEIELAYRFASAPLVGITGTNGKTTATTLLGEITEDLNRNVTVGGNIGRALIKDLPNLEEEDLAIAEISSFQLEWVKKFKTKISVVLNITPDHLNRHADFDEYINAKKRLVTQQQEDDYAILNYDDQIVRNFADDTKAEVIFFSRKEKVEGGVFVKDGWIINDLDYQGEQLIAVDDLGLVGPHNLENILAVVTCALLLGIAKEDLIATLKSFTGIEHRLEKFATIEGVTYINDSKATNPAAAIKGLQSFSDSVILIAGGMDKNSDFADFASEIPQRVKSLLLLGETAPEIEAEVKKLNYNNFLHVDSIAEAAEKAYTLAEEGDVVLLSPACASWDMFSSYKERGNLFKAAVNNLRGK
ncbi:UDP-N-acetylmuramoyl-L-alanine--D-glutamate ligase [Halanaerobacter jeridensis]|uniref:UDP-N-acetylmuramoylalanine--D-glutamate ligase n=1 Tax=Halanaerobacter jeridensis TaxID=706427 RepID=A0A938XX91_9FIRM|nr:UDP-N-acetylmuramoyl-L-alanine--D-glutamate ligase [Halanaerobacter jeridensis]MBM7557936.1 UDP-N-acetylmuramoylalanine--D-glutamate ligase [Halanaerobacter jeridensis]